MSILRPVSNLENIFLTDFALFVYLLLQQLVKMPEILIVFDLDLPHVVFLTVFIVL